MGAFGGPICGKAEMLDALEHFFAVEQEHRELALALDRSGLTGRFMQQVIKKTFDHAASQPATFPVQSPDTYRMVHTFFMCSLLILSLEWLQRGCPESPEAFARRTLHLFSRPFFPLIATP